MTLGGARGLALEEEDFSTSNGGGGLVKTIRVWLGFGHAWEQLRWLLLWPGSAAGCRGSRWPRCHPTAAAVDVQGSTALTFSNQTE